MCTIRYRRMVREVLHYMGFTLIGYSLYHNMNGKILYVFFYSIPWLLYVRKDFGCLYSSSPPAYILICILYLIMVCVPDEKTSMNSILVHMLFVHMGRWRASPFVKEDGIYYIQI
jgi:hypothetical protein